MLCKYQLILLGSLENLSDKLIDLFFKRIDELKLIKDTFVIIKEENFEKEYRKNQPAFAIYFGDKNGNFNHIGILQRLLKDKIMILPIYFEQNCFMKHIPKDIHGQNGLLYESMQDDKIINLILESFRLLRSSRKIFISYKRSESSSVAIQLYEVLEKSNFDVFLDTHSIKEGEPFQEELWHRMTDCDVIVLLNTKGFLDSEWCEKELAEAHSRQIGVIQLVWPNHKLERTAEICYPIQLNKTNFEGEEFEYKDRVKLTNLFLKELVKNVEAFRARNLVARQNSLITEFITTAKKYNKQTNLQPERFITENLDDNKKRIFVPTVGIPHSIDYYQNQELKHRISNYEVKSIH
jgi:hypothetical protein